MKTRQITILTAMLAGLMLGGCDRLDVAGMIVSSGTHTEDRVQQWLDWDAAHPAQEITGVPDEYKIYVCSDIHITDSAPRVEKFLHAEYNDAQAAFSIINGDLGNERGEDPFRVLDSLLRVPHPTSHALGTANDTCFVTIGNHDIYFDCQQYYEKYFHTSTYYVTVKTVSGAKDLFIFMDSGNATHGRKQLAWLKELLQHRSEYRHVVVSSHTCLFRNSYNYSTTPAANLPEDETYELMDLMNKNQVELFLMGHFHHKETHQIGNTQYVMTDNLNEDKETPSYVVVTCGNEVTTQYKDL